MWISVGVGGCGGVFKEEGKGFCLCNVNTKQERDMQLDLA